MQSKSRRQILGVLGAAGVMGAGVLPLTARAQAYPAKPIKVFVGFSPGGAVDLIARAVAQGRSLPSRTAPAAR